MVKNFFLLGLLAAFALTSCGKKPDYNVALKTDTDSMSYYMGLWTANSMKTSGEGLEDMNIDAFARGMSEAFKLDSLPVGEQDIATYLNGYFTKAQERGNAKNLEEGKAFLEANKTKEGVVTLPSGLQYQIIKDGTGVKPDTSSTVTVHYVGSLIDGTEFENSREADTPAVFPLNGGVIPGFKEALLNMKEGSTWKVFIPSELAYGTEVRPGGPIKPNSVLVFELELVKVEPTK